MKQIGRHFLNIFGILIRYCSCIHIFFEIGKCVPTEERKLHLQFMNILTTQFGTQHPIDKTVFDNKIKEAKQKNSETWVKCSTKQGLEELLGDSLKQWIFSEESLKVKTSLFYIRKAIRYLYFARKTITLYINRNNPNELVVSGIPHAMSSDKKQTSIYMIYNPHL